MTTKEALERVQAMLTYMETLDADEEEQKDIEGYRMAIEALQKQIPQQPTIERGFVKCPACKLYIRFPIMDHYNNCPECGQALKWRGDEE